MVCLLQRSRWSRECSRYGCGIASLSDHGHRVVEEDRVGRPSELAQCECRQTKAAAYQHRVHRRVEDAVPPTGRRRGLRLRVSPIVTINKGRPLTVIYRHHVTAPRPRPRPVLDQPWINTCRKRGMCWRTAAVHGRVTSLDYSCVRFLPRYGVYIDISPGRPPRDPRAVDLSVATSAINIRCSTSAHQTR